MQSFLASIINIATNRFLLIPIGAMLAAQVIKFFYYSLRDRRIDFTMIYSTGRMPSSHSAFVSSIVTLVGLHDGFGSILFAVSMVFALIVMYDATGIRRAAGKQAEVLNRIIDEMKAKKFVQGRLKEFLGHTPVEVHAGALIGILIAVLFY